MYKSLRIVRPINLIIIALTMFVVSWFFFEQSLVELLSDSIFWSKTLVMVTLAASGNMINDYFDLTVDEINRPDRISIGKYWSKRGVMMMYVELSVLVVVFTYFLYSHFEHFIFITIPLTMWFGLLLYTPILKRWHFIGNSWVALCTAMVPIWAILGSPVNQSSQGKWEIIFFFSCLAFFVNLLREVLKDIEDKEGDKRGGYRSVIIAFGSRFTLYMVFSISIAILVLELIFFSLYGSKGFSRFLFLILVVVPTLVFLWQMARRNPLMEPALLSKNLKSMMLMALVFLVLSKWI